MSPPSGYTIEKSVARRGPDATRPGSWNRYRWKRGSDTGEYFDSRYAAVMNAWHDHKERTS